MILKCLMVLACSTLVLSNANDRALEDRLYNEVSTAAYDDAVATAKELTSQHKGSVIRETLQSLTYSKVRNAMEYAYKLWISGNADIVKNYFPVSFRAILTGKVKFIDYHYTKAMKLGYETDSANDRTAYGDNEDKSSSRIAWKLIPVWENDRLYFKILNINHNQYLKLGVAVDYAGDHTTYAGDSAVDDRHLWYLHPMQFNYKLVFYIFNKQYDQAIKLGSHADWAGDHTVFGHNGEVFNDPDVYSWFIKPF